MSPQIHLVCLALLARSLARSSHNVALTTSRNSGKIKVRPYAIIITADILVHTVWGISISAVDALSTMVNNVINTAVDNIMINGLYRCFDHNDPHKITGNTGSTHGASTLSTPAINERIANDIVDDKDK